MLKNQNMDWQGRMLGRYRLMQCIGKGGMGEVWLADDTQLRRQVAAKLLPAVLAGNRDYLQAFAYEARAAAALEHPNILPVHDFGEEPIADGTIVTYLIMPFIAGGSLRSRIYGVTGLLPVDESLHYLKQAAAAIDYAHSQQVLHRDIKPANMLLQQRWLFLADFGLAKLLASTTQRGQTHAGSGTPEYMAPEQAEGHAEPASDRYSFAMIAYQLFTGTLPFRGRSVQEILLKQLRDMPPPPRQLAPAMPRAVEDLLLQGLAKRAQERPASCSAFVEALEQAWQQPSQPQEAPQNAFLALPLPTSSDLEATVLAPWSKRLRALTPAPPLPFSMTPVPAPAPHEAASAPVSASDSAQPAPGAASAPIPAQVPTEPHTSYGAPPPDEVQVRSGTTEKTPAIPAPAPANARAPYAPPPAQAFPTPAPGVAPALAVTAPHPAYPPISSGMQPPVTPGPAQSPYGAFPATLPSPAPGAPGTPRTGYGQFPDNGRFTVPPVPPSPERQRQISRRTLLVGGATTAAIIAAGGIGLMLFSRPTVDQTVKPTPGPHKLIPGIPLLALTGHTNQVWTAVWDPTGRYLATGGEDARLMLWDIGSYLQKGGHKFQTIATPLNSWKFSDNIYNNTVSWSPDGRSLAVVVSGQPNRFFMVDAFARGSKMTTYLDASQANSFSAPSYSNIAWAPHSNIFATSIFETEDVALWQLGKPFAPVGGMQGPKPPSGVAMDVIGWSMDGAYLAGVTNDFKIVVWQVKTRKVREVITLPSRSNAQAVFTLRDALAWSPTSAPLFVTSDLDVALVYDAARSKLQLMLGTDDPEALTVPKVKSDLTLVPNVDGLAWSPNGRYIVGSYGRSRKLYVWDTQQTSSTRVKNGVRLQTMLFGAEGGHSDTVIDVAWSPDGRYVASTSYDKTVIVWQVDGA